MYIWIAIDVDDQVRELRNEAEKYVKKYLLTSSTLTLPFHISLKISFEVPPEISRAVINDVRELFRGLKPFTVPVDGLQRSSNILWLIMKDCDKLSTIHSALDKLLSEKYGVAQHQFDKEFIFHTSILILDGDDHLDRALERLKALSAPTVFRAERVIIGTSLTGEAGTYTVDEEIPL